MITVISCGIVKHALSPAACAEACQYTRDAVVDVEVSVEPTLDVQVHRP